MKYNKEMLVEMLIQDEKLYYDMPEYEWEMIKDEYETQLDKMGIKCANAFEVLGCGEDGEVIYDFGLDKKVYVCGQGCLRRMFWEN